VASAKLCNLRGQQPLFESAIAGSKTLNDMLQYDVKDTWA